jgi:hypothetical protein
MLLPLLLSFFATLAAAVMSYGVHSGLGKYSWGVDAIMLARRMQWPLVGVSLVLCFALLGLVISAKRRAWWLIALAPVLMLFVHRFWTSPVNRYAVIGEPTFVVARDATWLRDDDELMTLSFNGQAYAYPLAWLASSPVVVQDDREHRMLLMYSPKLQSATAFNVTRELKARDLDVISEPADALLIYNSRRGQFISAATGMTPRGEKPANLSTDLKPTMTKAKPWREVHPDGKVMLPIK